MSALSSIKVADISGTVATSYAAKQFADYGAQVFNLEPPEGFSTRTLSPFIPETQLSAMHGYLHANKHSAIASGNFEEINQVDLLIYDPSITSLDNAACQTNTCAISWFGKYGPYADFVGSDGICSAMIGQARTIGPIEGPPLIPTGYGIQILGGLSAYIGAMGHLLGQRLGNLSENFHLDSSVLEASLCLVDTTFFFAHYEGNVPPRLGINRYPPAYPLGVFPCKDGWLGVTVLTPSQWQSFCKLLELDDLAQVPLFQQTLARLEATDLIEPMMCERLLQHSAEELFYKGQNARVPLARVPTMEELFGVDQYLQRHAFSNINCAGHTFKAPSTPFRLFATPPLFGGSVAAIGEHQENWLSLGRVGATAP